MRLFFLPYLGGSYNDYQDFRQYLSEGISPVFLELPGHGRRIEEPLLTDLNDMAEDMLVQIESVSDEPYALYGHCMGAMLAYLAACKVAAEKMPEPLHLFVTGRGGPSAEIKVKDAHLLPSQELIRRFQEDGGEIPEEILADKALLDFLEPIYRADFQASGTYIHRDTEPLSTPITVMMGLNDTTTYQEALKWQEVTRKKITVRQFPGGHFFIFEHLAEICRIISQTIWESVRK